MDDNGTVKSHAFSVPIEDEHVCQFVLFVHYETRASGGVLFLQE